METMWIFATYGFYSIGCARKHDGSLDTRTVMIRARCKNHLAALKKRFASLTDAEILVTPVNDYRYRLIVPKSTWAVVLVEMTEEQEWSNFKREAALRGGKRGDAYVVALHDVWETMRRLQK
jgi:hypothetical protein